MFVLYHSCTCVSVHVCVVCVCMYVKEAIYKVQLVGNDTPLAGWMVCQPAICSDGGAVGCCQLARLALRAFLQGSTGWLLGLSPCFVALCPPITPLPTFALRLPNAPSYIHPSHATGTASRSRWNLLRSWPITTSCSSCRATGRLHGCAVGVLGLEYWQCSL